MKPGDLTTLANLKQWLGLTGLAVSAITNGSPTVLTLQTRPSTPLLSGVAYTIEGATGIVLPAGQYIITVIDPLNFSIPYDSTTNGTYTGGAVVAIADPLLERLISSCSTFIQSWLNRTIRNLSYNETRNGLGGQTMMAKNFPITSVTSVTIDGIVIPPRPPLANLQNWSGPGGYTFDELSFMLDNTQFCRGHQNVNLQYAAGFLIADEAQTLPSLGPYTLTTQAHWSAGDRGVTYADGTPLRAVASSPNQGEYSVSGSDYTFNPLDGGQVLLLSYSYVPFDLEQATIDMIGDWFRYVDRIGKTSQSIEGQTTSFVNVPIPARALGVLQQYRNVSPIY